MTIIGERIYDLRNRNNMSQGKLADKLDVSRQTVSKWENNMCLPEAEKLLQLSEIFGVSTDYILKGRTIVEPEPVYIYVKDPDSENVSKYNEKLIKKYVGITLASLGGFLTIVCAVAESVFVFCAAPLTILGILLACNAKHILLILSWLFYAIYSLYWLGSDLTLFFVFLPDAYQPVNNIRDLLPLAMAYSLWAFLAILIFFTIKAKRGYIFNKDKTEQ